MVTADGVERQIARKDVVGHLEPLPRPLPATLPITGGALAIVHDGNVAREGGPRKAWTVTKNVLDP